MSTGFKDGLSIGESSGWEATLLLEKFKNPESTDITVKAEAFHAVLKEAYLRGSHAALEWVEQRRREKEKEALS